MKKNQREALINLVQFMDINVLEYIQKNGKELGMSDKEINTFLSSYSTYTDKVLDKYGLSGIERFFSLKKPKYKKAGHLADQMLKHGDNIVIDSLSETTKTAINDSRELIERKHIVEGINLSPSETKVIDCLCKLLHESSQTQDPTKEDYYLGNIGFELVDFSGDTTPAPKLAFTLYELTKEYKGGDYVGGKDIENVKTILTGLESKKYLFRYTETCKTDTGGRIERKIETYNKLISICKITETRYNQNNIELSKIEDTVIILNPIFRRQIGGKYILYPSDINRRTVLAYGSDKVSITALRLRDYLMREHSSKRYKPEIGLYNLYMLLAEKYMSEGRKKKVKEATNKAIETVKALGLLNSYEEVINSKGDSKIIFYLNKDWE